MNRVEARATVVGIFATMAGLLVVAAASHASAGSVPCPSLDLQVAIVPTEPPECTGGSSDDGDAHGEWEYIELYVDELFVGVAKERAGVRSVFYRPTLEGFVPNIVAEDADIEWGDEIDDERFDVRRFDLVLDKRTTLLCVGFLDSGPSFMGSEVKSVIYGMFCNLDGSVFFDSDVTELLAKIGR